MAKSNPTLLTTSGSATSVTTMSTAAINPTAGSRLLLAVAFRSTDLASVAAEVFSVAGCAATWIEKVRINYDSSNRMAAAVFEGSGAFTNEAVVIKFVSDRGFSTRAWAILQLNADGTIVLVHATPVSGGTASTPFNMVLPGVAGSIPIVLAFCDSVAITLSSDAGFTDLTVATTGVPKLMAYHANPDATPGVNRSGTGEAIGFAVEFTETVTARSADGRHMPRGLSRGLRRGLAG